MGVAALFVGVWFVGETRRAAQARSAAAPVLQSRPTTYAIAAVAIRTALSDRELEILKQLASGKSNNEIARDLSLSPNTVAMVERVRCNIWVASCTRSSSPSHATVTACSSIAVTSAPTS